MDVTAGSKEVIRGYQKYEKGKDLCALLLLPSEFLLWTQYM